MVGQLDGLTRWRSWMRKPAVWAVIVFLLWWGVTLWWLVADQRPPASDAGGHAAATLCAASRWTNHVLWDHCADVLLKAKYPPLVYYVGAPVAMVFPHADVVTIWLALVFGGLLSVSLFQMARLVGVPWAGVGAIMFALSQRLMFVTSRAVMLDFPLAAMVTWAYWQVLVSDRHRTGRRAIVLGLVLGLGVLTKWSFVLYVAPALAWLGYRWFRFDPHRTHWRLAMSVLLVMAAVCGWWYGPRWSGLLSFLQNNAYESLEYTGSPPIWSVSSWLFYLDAYQSVVPLAAWIVAVGFCLWRGSQTSRILALWIVVGYGLLALSPNKDTRYLLPFIPLTSFLSWWVIVSLPRRWWRRVIASMLTVWCVGQVGVLSSHQLDHWIGADVHPRWAFGKSLFARGTLFSGLAPPMPDVSVLSSIMDRMEEQGVSRAIRVLMLPSVDMYHNAPTLFYEMYRRGMIVALYTTGETPMSPTVLAALKDLPYDFILSRMPPHYTHFPFSEQEYQAFKELLRPEARRYRLAKRFAFPAGMDLESPEAGAMEVYVPWSP